MRPNSNFFFILSEPVIISLDLHLTAALISDCFFFISGLLVFFCVNSSDASYLTLEILFFTESYRHSKKKNRDQKKPNKCNILLSTLSTPHLYTGTFDKDERGGRMKWRRRRNEGKGNLFNIVPSGINTLRHRSVPQGHETLKEMDCSLKGKVFAQVTKSKQMERIVSYLYSLLSWNTTVQVYLLVKQEEKIWNSLLKYRFFSFL